MRTSIPILIAVLFSAAWIWRMLVFCLLSDYGTSTLFQYSTQLPGTLDQFAMGILLSKLMLDKRYAGAIGWIKRHYIALLFGSLLICAAMFTIRLTNASYWSSFFMASLFRSLIGVAASALILSAMLWPWKVPHPLSFPLDFLGEISYGLYLWHLPVILSLKRLSSEPGIFFLVRTLLATIVLATISYYLFEKSWMRSARVCIHPPLPQHPHTSP